MDLLNREDRGYFKKLELALPEIFEYLELSNVGRMFELGAKQHEQFVETRLQKGSLMVVDTKISKNLFKLPSSASALKADTDQIKLNQLTLTKLDSSCQNRRAAALELFKTEFTSVPECFLKDGIPFHGTKSDILKYILPTSCNGDPSVSTDDQDGESFDVYIHYIIDLSVQIRAKASVRDSLDKEMTYSQFC